MIHLRKIFNLLASTSICKHFIDFHRDKTTQDNESESSHTKNFAHIHDFPSEKGFSLSVQEAKLFLCIQVSMQKGYKCRSDKNSFIFNRIRFLSSRLRNDGDNAVVRPHRCV